LQCFDDLLQDDSVDDEDAAAQQEDEVEAITDEDDTNEAATSQNSMSMSKNKFHLPEYVTNRIDPLLWKQETERVSTLLKRQSASSPATSATSWQHHVDMLVSYCTKQVQYLKREQQQQRMVNGIDPLVLLDPSERPVGKAGRLPVELLKSSTGTSATSTTTTTIEKSTLTVGLSQLRALVHADIQQIQQKEKYLNASPQLSAFCLQYSACKQVCTALLLVMVVIIVILMLTGIVIVVML
jgi:hypothetical protein